MIVLAYDLKSLILFDGKVGGSLTSYTLGNNLAKGIMIDDPNIPSICVISTFLDI